MLPPPPHYVVNSAESPPNSKNGYNKASKLAREYSKTVKDHTVFK